MPPKDTFSIILTRLKNAVHSSDTTSALDAQRGIFFLSIMGATLFCLAVSTPLNIIFYPEAKMLALVVFLASIATFCFAVIYIKWGHRLLLSMLWFLGFSLLILLIDLPVAGGVASPDIAWLYLMAAVMCMITTMTLGFLLALTCTGLLIGLFIAGAYGQAAMPEPAYFMATYMAVGFFTLVLVFMFNVLRKVTLQESKLRKENYKQLSNQLLSSIEYARRIRAGILPSADFTDTPVKDMRQWESAKQAISGDFLYSRHQGKRLFICLADSSGHGVPGSIISALGICFLDEAILGLWMTEPKDILHYIRTQFRNKVRTLSPEDPLDDGMVAAVVCIDTESNELRVASSQTLVKIKTVQGWQTIKASRYPLAYHPTNHLPFTQQTFALPDVKELFMATDGITDQLSPEGKRFTRGRLDDFCKQLPIEKPLGYCLDTFRDKVLAWQGNAPQTDDILAVWMHIDSTAKAQQTTAPTCALAAA